MVTYLRIVGVILRVRTMYGTPSQPMHLVVILAEDVLLGCKQIKVTVNGMLVFELVRMSFQTARVALVVIQTSVIMQMR